ncbi:hypothetical protein PanWU01x14_093020 [Parasponia andersonii]|uniref:Uncharacterized protein n=1 Tax=Parasponia andersonii TaxID=3476 RepID=A0A2P5D5Y1_PARAD|nr:hypothetical protein PanWU01x14_093020 [Parasponia andersonii]
MTKYGMATKKETSEMTSCYCTYVWGNFVTWQSKKQSVVARSSAAAEFRAITHGICEEMWLKRLLQELQVTLNGSMEMFCKNQAVISIARNPVHYDRTKHVEIDPYFIKEKIEEGIINLKYTTTAQQIVDILIKALPITSFEDLRSKLGMIDIYNPA